MESYYWQLGVMKGTLILIALYLIRLLWRFENLNRQQKKEWTWLLLLFSEITIPIYLWRKIDQHLQTTNPT